MLSGDTAVVSGARKVCARCKLDILITRFGPDGRSKDGVRSYCKQCNSEASRRSRAKKAGKPYVPLPDREGLQTGLTTPLGWKWLQQWFEQNISPAAFAALEEQWVEKKQEERSKELDVLEREFFLAAENSVDEDTLECEDCGEKACVCEGAFEDLTP